MQTVLLLAALLTAQVHIVSTRPVSMTLDEMVRITPEMPTLDEIETTRQMLAHSNAIRMAAGKPPQALDERLCRAAQEQADYLARTGQFDHYANGNPRSRAAKHGFPVANENDIAAVQENIAGGFQTAANAFKGWTGSQGHYAAILADRPLCGFGVAQDRSRWVALYGNETPSASPDPYTVGIFGNCVGGACASPVAVRRQRYVQAPPQAQAPKQYQGRQSRGNAGGWRPGKFVGKVLGR